MTITKKPVRRNSAEKKPADAQAKAAQDPTPEKTAEAKPAAAKKAAAKPVAKPAAKPAVKKAPPAKPAAKPAAKAATRPAAKKTVSAETFIEAAHHPVAATGANGPEKAEDAAKAKKKDKGKEKKKKKDKKNKEAVLIRFEDDQLPQIDARAESLGLSRAAWVRMVVAQALIKG